MAISFAGTAYAQDSPSLGDLARRQRQQKELSNTMPEKVITNEEIPEHPESEPEAAVDSPSAMPVSPRGAKESPEAVKMRCRWQKYQVAFLQRRIEETIKSILRAPVDCANGCPHWNERYSKKELQIERMQAQLQDAKKRLEQMQESARKQGYGNSVYDP